MYFFSYSDMAFGDIRHTGMHNRFGGYENDCSVARLSENRFMLMSPSIQQMKVAENLFPRMIFFLRELVPGVIRTFHFHQGF